MTNELIQKELKSFFFQEDRLKTALERERLQLEQYAQKGDASPAYVSRQNRLMITIWDYIEATGALLDSITTAQKIAAYQPPPAPQISHYENKRLQEENYKLRSYLQYLGRDPELIRFMTVRDFTNY